MHTIALPFHKAYHHYLFVVAENFSKRVKVFRKWLMDRPESVIAVVAHWGVLLELTGRDFGRLWLSF